MPTELSLDELHGMHTEAALVEEATRMETVPTGLYTFQASKVTAQVDDRETFPNSGDSNPNYLRKGVRIFGNLAQDGARKGRIGFNASWELKRYTTGKSIGKLDAESKLWGQIVKAFKADGKSVGDVVNMLTQYPVMIYVTETFKTADGWKSPQTPKEKKVLLESGVKPQNFVQNVSVVKV